MQTRALVSSIFVWLRRYGGMSTSRNQTIYRCIMFGIYYSQSHIRLQQTSLYEHPRPYGSRHTRTHSELLGSVRSVGVMVKSANVIKIMNGNVAYSLLFGLYGWSYKYAWTEIGIAREFRRKRIDPCWNSFLNSIGGLSENIENTYPKQKDWFIVFKARG